MRIRETLQAALGNMGNRVFWGQKKENKQQLPQKTKDQQKKPTGDDSAWRGAKHYHLSRNNYLQVQKMILLAALAIFWDVGQTRLTLYQQCRFRGKEKMPLERRSRSIVRLTPEGPTLQENCADYTKPEVSKSQAMEENGTRWSSRETPSENMTGFQEHKMCCKDKWNNLLSSSRVNRTKAISYVERLEIRKNFQEVRLMKQSNQLSRGDAEIQQWRSLRTSYINICQEWQTYSGSCCRPIRWTGCVPELFPAVFPMILV